MERGELAAIALRYDTRMSRAMLKALGISPHRPPRHGATRTHGKYDGIRECMAQRTGVRV